GVALGSKRALLCLSDSTTPYEGGGSSHNISVPAATLLFDPAATAAETAFDAAAGSWSTIVPASTAGSVFLSGLAVRVPAEGFPEGISSATWSVAISTDTPGVTAQWEWDASVYAALPGDYNELAVKTTEGESSLGSVAGARMSRTEIRRSPGTPEGANGEAADLTVSVGPAGEVTPCGVGTSGGAQKVSRTTIRLNPRGGPHSPVPL